MARAEGKCKQRQGKVNRARWATFGTFLSMKCDICSILSSTVAGPSICDRIICMGNPDRAGDSPLQISPAMPQVWERMWEEPCCAWREVWLSDSNQAVGGRLSWSKAQQHPSVTNSSCSSMFIPHRQVADVNSGTLSINQARATPKAYSHFVLSEPIATSI